MKNWVITAKRADFNAIAAQFSIDPVIARLIRNRDIVGEDAIEEYLNGSLLNITDPHLLYGLDCAVSILMDKIDRQKTIRIIGDYDIDGVTATYILMSGLERCGAIVDYEIPDRIKDGYGINEILIREAAEDGIDTIITCDNGISAYEEIRLGKELGMTMVVTDHHAIPTEETEAGVKEKLPPADVIVNPHQQRCKYPFKNICGAVIAYKLIQCLYEACRVSAEELAPLTEFAAIATIGDVCVLQGENRILVKEGLLSLNNTSNPGLRALINVNNLQDKEINSYHIGFQIGPCINATGRLDTAKKALQLFLSTSEAEATELAEELCMINNERKEMTLKGIEEAIELIENSSLQYDKVLVIYLPDCHESIAGIIAGRLRERYYKPVFVLTPGENCIKGSGRSIERYSMYEEMLKCHELFIKYGGHPMAAGLSIAEENIELLRQTLNRNTTLTDTDLIEKVVIDIPMPIDYISLDLIEELNILEPFGAGNEKPKFAARNLRILNARCLGKLNNFLKMSVQSEQGTIMDAVMGGEANIMAFRSYLEEKYTYQEVEDLFSGRPAYITVDAIYYPEINEYMGMRTPQIRFQDYR